MKFLQTLSESRLLSSTSAYRNFSGKQIAELVYLHVIALRILATEHISIHFSEDYARKTTRYNGFARWYQNTTDLYLLIHALLDEDVDLKLPDASKEFKETLYFDEHELLVWLKDIARGHIVEPRTRQLFVHLDGQFQIKNGSMKAIRRLVQDWPHNSQSQKQLSMTRLLQILRVRARRSDLLSELEDLATELQLEIMNVNNLETGDEAHHDGSHPQHEPKQPSKIVKALTVAGGAMLGYSLIRSLSEGEIVFSSDTITIVENPNISQFFDMKKNSGDGINGILSDNKLYVWDANLPHDMVVKHLNLGESRVDLGLWANYIEVYMGSDDNLRERSYDALDEIDACPALLGIYGFEPAIMFVGVEDHISEEELLNEDAAACVTSSASIASVVQPLGMVQRRAPISPRKKKKKK